MTQMDDRNFPWHLGFGNKFDPRNTNSGQVCVGFLLFPATVFLIEFFRERFKEIPFWVKRAIVKKFLGYFVHAHGKKCDPWLQKKNKII